MSKIRFKRLAKAKVARDQNGFTLVEAVIAIALLGIIAAGLFTGLGTASKVLLHTDVKETAKNLAETVMESIKGQTYSTVYSTSDIPIPLDYTVLPPEVIDGTDPFFGPDTEQQRNSALQKITVTIKGPVGTGVIYKLEGYRAR
jgi:prepilin-type N-terminal cleavage/methylation domain-containing protein